METRTSKIFGKNLRKIREELDLSQEKFAEIINIDSRSISDIENGKYLPSPKNIDKICGNLNRTISDMFVEVQEENTDKRTEKIRLINLKLSILNDEKLDIVYKIVNNVFD